MRGRPGADPVAATRALNAGRGRRRTLRRGDHLQRLLTRVRPGGMRVDADELAPRASGETLNPAHFKAHLEQRSLG